MIEAAQAEYEIVAVPGALEVPGAIALAAEAADPYDGYVAIGVVIRGETSHYDIVAGEFGAGHHGADARRVCIGNGIVTVENEAQAWSRARRSERTRAAMRPVPA